MHRMPQDTNDVPSPLAPYPLQKKIQVLIARETAHDRVPPYVIPLTFLCLLECHGYVVGSSVALPGIPSLTLRFAVLRFCHLLAFRYRSRLSVCRGLCRG